MKAVVVLLAAIASASVAALGQGQFFLNTHDPTAGNVITFTANGEPASGTDIAGEVVQVLRLRPFERIARTLCFGYSQPVLDDAAIDQLNRTYVCPPGAGPAWRAACEYGLDMSLVEDALAMTPEQRLEEHQHALNLLLEIEASRESNAAR